mmetsp:Transcript_48407/g.140225  ORF Transcript_48407/g.140225 Transcript_48407/m.140225 type:complete len:214 (-) Transcript_48407:12-653(-)
MNGPWLLGCAFPFFASVLAAAAPACSVAEFANRALGRSWFRASASSSRGRFAPRPGGLLCSTASSWLGWRPNLTVFPGFHSRIMPKASFSLSRKVPFELPKSLIQALPSALKRTAACVREVCAPLSITPGGSTKRPRKTWSLPERSSSRLSWPSAVKTRTVRGASARGTAHQCGFSWGGILDRGQTFTRTSSRRTSVRQTTRGAIDVTEAGQA